MRAGILYVPIGSSLSLLILVMEVIQAHPTVLSGPRLLIELMDGGLLPLGAPHLHVFNDLVALHVLGKLFRLYIFERCEGLVIGKAFEEELAAVSFRILPFVSAVLRISDSMLLGLSPFKEGSDGLLLLFSQVLVKFRQFDVFFSGVVLTMMILAFFQVIFIVLSFIALIPP